MPRNTPTRASAVRAALAIATLAAEEERTVSLRRALSLRVLKALGKRLRFLGTPQAIAAALALATAPKPKPSSAYEDLCAAMAGMHI